MLAQILAELAPYRAKLIAVSKTHPESAIMELYRQGQRIFGENRVQELKAKYENLPKDIEWHLIGHLQTNKVKYIASFVSCIHSVDSLKLLAEIDRQAQKHQRRIPCLFQFHIAKEETKFGLTLEEAEAILQSADFTRFDHVQIAGLMGMASFTDNMAQVRAEFRQLKQYFDYLKSKYFARDAAFREISMGMSGDYKIALEEGSTMVRIGTILFGGRT